MKRWKFHAYGNLYLINNARLFAHRKEKKRTRRPYRKRMGGTNRRHSERQIYGEVFQRILRHVLFKMLAIKKSFLTSNQSANNIDSQIHFLAPIRERVSHRL